MREDAPNRRRRLCVTVHGAVALHRWASTPSASCWRGVHQAEGCRWLVRQRHRRYQRCDSPHASGRGSSNRMARSNRHRRRRTGSRRGHPVHERHVERHHAHRHRGDAQRTTDGQGCSSVNPCSSSSPPRLDATSSRSCATPAKLGDRNSCKLIETSSIRPFTRSAVIRKSATNGTIYLQPIWLDRELTVATVLAAHRRHYIAHPQKLMA
jgi:hypothetical protein